jgi:hypothetical protein
MKRPVDHVHQWEQTSNKGDACCKICGKIKMWSYDFIKKIFLLTHEEQLKIVKYVNEKLEEQQNNKKKYLQQS